MLDQGSVTFTDPLVTGNSFSVNLPKYSKWKCELFGSGPMGICFRPLEGKEPNFFWRWMQYLAFGNRWIKDKEG